MEELLSKCIKKFVVIYNKALTLEERHSSNQSKSKLEYLEEPFKFVSSEHLEIGNETKKLFDDLTNMRIELSDYDYDNELFHQLTKVLNDCTVIQHYDREDLDIYSFLDEITSQSVWLTDLEEFKREFESTLKG